MRRLLKYTKEKILSQFELIKLANSGNEKAQEILEESLKDRVNSASNSKSSDKSDKSDKSNRNNKN
ncbi:MAG: hypothetical protein ACK4MM_05365 [Fervidobacterium sp.]